jgi:transmembrane sensor
MKKDNNIDMNTTRNDKDVFLAQWMEGAISNAELKKLVSEEDYNAFIKIKAGIEVFVEIEKPLDATFNSIKDKIKIKTNKKPKGKIINLYSKVAISIAASIVLFFSINTFFLNKDVSFHANFGEQQVVALLDGSEVILNAKSELKYNKKNWKNNREIFLSGEAFFKVKKGSKFTVTTTNGTVTVLGTKFNVNANKNFFDVICYEGKVKVISNYNEQIITRNQAVRNTNGLTAYNPNLTDDNPSWISGESSFESVPLSLVIDALHNQFNLDFDTSNVNTSIVFTGSFDNKNLEVALASVFETVNIKYTNENSIIKLSK